MQAIGSFAAGILAAALAACAADPPPLAGSMTAMAVCDSAARPMARSELVFGTARPAGRVVGEAEWADFLEAEVTPRFPDGLTVLSGLGDAP